MLFKFLWRKKEVQPDFCDTQLSDMDDLIGDFMEAITDVRSPAKDRLNAALISCQTPKELWFLRDKVFNLLAHQFSESQAHFRLEGLDSKLAFFVSHHDEYDPDELPSRPLALLH